MKKKLISIILVLAIALTVCSCQNGSEAQISDRQESSSNIEQNSERDSSEILAEETDATIQTDEQSKGKDVSESDNSSLVQDESSQQANDNDSSGITDESSTKAETVIDNQALYNSIAMMNYLAFVAEEIRGSRDNRLVLEEILTSLYNDLNASSIDEKTQEHLRELRDVIKGYRNIAIKRERLQFVYNQEKAIAIRSAMPNPLAAFSMTQSFNWKQLAVSVVYSVVDSYNSYKSANESADMQFIMSGWELDDEEEEQVQRNRDSAFDYMVDMVQEYKLDGLHTLGEKDVESFVKICAIENATERINRLRAEESKYELLGPYWLELADCYFETNENIKCLECVEKYLNLSIKIFKTDIELAKILPKAIVAAQIVYADNSVEYIVQVERYVELLVNNTSTEDWAMRYFAAQVYLDLYARSNDETYLNKAYELIYNNVTVLLEAQRNLNKTYLNEIEEYIPEEPDYRYLSKTEKEEKEKEYKEEKKRAKEYNQALKEVRKTELPPLYEPLVLNCELLFKLTEIMGISETDKNEIERLLQIADSGIFLQLPINEAFSFGNTNIQYQMKLTEDELVVPAVYMTPESYIVISVNDGNNTLIFDDCIVTKVDRTGTEANTFEVHIKSESFKKHVWTDGSIVTITIVCPELLDCSVSSTFSVNVVEKFILGVKVGKEVEFIQE